MTRFTQVIRGVGGLIVLILLIGGTPFALWQLAGNPLPDHIPSAGEVGRALTSRDDGQLFLGTLAVLGWLLWASFVVAVAVEIPAHLRGRRTPRVPMLGMQQRIAAGLIAAIAALFTSPTLASAAAQPVYAAVSTDTAVVESANHETETAAAMRADYVIHTVAPGETTASITRLYTGDPANFQKILDANIDRIQPDGSALRAGEVSVKPGWQLRIPTSIIAVTTQPAEPGEGERLIVVDNPSSLATLVAQEAPGLTWQAVYQRNRGLTQPDGRQLHDPARVQAGWQIILPAAAAEPATKAAPTSPSTVNPTYRVERGDRMWDIADRFLGDPLRYVDIEKLNPQYERADHRFPDHIEATWELTLPADAQDRGARKHATGKLITPANQKPAAAATDATGDNQQKPGDQQPVQMTVPAPAPETAAPTPAQLTPPVQSATPTATTSTPPTSRADASGVSRPAPTTAPASTPVAEDTGTDRAAITTLGGTGILAALIMGAVLARRRREQHRRRPGRRISQPRAGATERNLRVAEQPADVDRLDLALRHLAAGLADRDQHQLPDIVGVWLDAGTVRVILATPCGDPPAPWTSTGTEWTLPATADVTAPAGQAPPLPTLVTVASQPGRYLLLDLERMGAVSISGDPVRAMALLRYLASELACNIWSDDVEVIIAGFPMAEAELLVALNPERVRAVAAVTDAAARLRQRVATAKTTLVHAGAIDAFAARVGDLAGDAWMPQVLLVANPTEHDLQALASLDAELRAAGRCAVAVAITHPAGHTLGQALTVSSTGDLHVNLPALNTSAAAAGIPAEELEPLAEIMRQARAAIDEPVPAAPETESWATDTDAAGSILTLFAPGKATTPTADNDSPHDDWPPAATGPQPQTPEQRQPAAISQEPPSPPALIEVPRVQINAAIRQRRRQADPHLDADLKAWRDQDPSRPRIGILGPVTVHAPGPEPTERRRFLAEVIVYLAQRGARGADRNQLEHALWPNERVKDGSLRVAISRSRRWLGEKPDGTAWLPDMGADRAYRLAEGYLLDWHLFRRLRARGEAHGLAGVKDLHAALSLVRGVPLDGADRAWAAGARNPYTWLPESDIYPAHITSAIIDTAHELAELYLAAGDTANARWAVGQAWLADPYRSEDQLWYDMMRAEKADGHTAQLRQLLAELLRARDAEVPEDLQPATYERLQELMPDILAAPVS